MSIKSGNLDENQFSLLLWCCILQFFAFSVISPFSSYFQLLDFEKFCALFEQTFRKYLKNFVSFMASSSSDEVDVKRLNAEMG